ncbi:AAA family ATPase [Bacillus sp. EB93]|nr:AAA family ATPase [Peribacillus frigoritolerans]
MGERNFPEELLYGTLEEKYNYFKEYPLSHPKFSESFRQLIKMINISEDDDSVIFVYGPTRVGKTFMSWRVLETIEQKYADEMETNKGLIPVIRVEATSPENGNFNWQDFYIMALQELREREELIDHKIKPPNHKGHRTKLIDESRKTEALNRALVSALKHRGTKVLLIDEAHHMSKRKRGIELQNQIDVLKSLSNKTGVPIVLFGTYELQLFKDKSDQLISRGMHNHLSRYRYEIEEERIHFVRCLLSLQELLPLKIEPNLVNHYEYFYTRTLGCVGQLKKLFNRTYRAKLEENPNIETLEFEDFQLFALDLDQCETIRAEIVKGENKEKQKITEEVLLKRLKMIDDEPLNEEESESEIDQTNDKEEIDKPMNKKKDIKSEKTKPFERNAKRDSTEVSKEFEA